MQRANTSEKSHILLAQSNFELAVKFLERALQLEPGNLEARELIGVAELEGGDADKGRQVSMASDERSRWVMCFDAQTRSVGRGSTFCLYNRYTTLCSLTL